MDARSYSLSHSFAYARALSLYLSLYVSQPPSPPSSVLLPLPSLSLPIHSNAVFALLIHAFILRSNIIIIFGTHNDVTTQCFSYSSILSCVLFVVYSQVSCIIQTPCLCVFVCVYCVIENEMKYLM